MNSLHKYIRRLMYFAFCIGLAAPCNGENVPESLNPATFVQLDLEAKRITLEGVKERLYLLQLNADLNTQLQQSVETQNKVQQLYLEQNLTLAKTLAWARGHQSEISSWIASHPEIEHEYSSLSQQLEATSAQIQSLVQEVTP